MLWFERCSLWFRVGRWGSVRRDFGNGDLSMDMMRFGLCGGWELSCSTSETVSQELWGGF